MDQDPKTLTYFEALIVINTELENAMISNLTMVGEDQIKKAWEMVRECARVGMKQSTRHLNSGL